MGKNVVQKILSEHLVEGELEIGREIAIRIDQTLTQDATGTVAYLQFEAMGLPRVKTKLSVSYVDHNTLQTGFENADDHIYLETVAQRYGILFSRPGNGICHQVHLERFAEPGGTLLGSDSHTPTAGGVGMLAIGAGGLDVAVAMGGGPFYLSMPKIVKVELTGKLGSWVSGKDIILELLRLLTVKGGVGKILEYAGDGVKTLSVPERATITNMGAELGATTSVFPSDNKTKEFLLAQRRGGKWRGLVADKDAEYDEVVKINLNKLVPLVARPHSPDNVCKVTELEGLKVNQVIIGSCTNSSYRDLMTVAGILKGKTIHPEISFIIAPGSRQVLEMIARNGALATLISAGARIIETACGPCIGMGQAPPTKGVSLRTFNRNFEGRSGTKSAQVYLASPEVAASTALKGRISDPRKLRQRVRVSIPKLFHIDDSMIKKPPKDGRKVKVVRGPNIKPLPIRERLVDHLEGEVLLKLGDNVTTDHILPAGAKILPLRSNIPAISEYVFSGIDPGFARRARAAGGGVVVGGENYGQGSSREHAALAPMYLGIKWICSKSFARIHRANLVNFGILPLTFVNPLDYRYLSQGDRLEITGVIGALRESKPLIIRNRTNGTSIEVAYDLTPRQKEILMAGGLLNYMRRLKRKKAS
ncbi:MAG: aconitate hydratase [Candidatus Glassbacteria bacterium]